MGDTWITDLRHFLDDGRLPPGLPTAALNLALHLGAIVAWMTSREIQGVERTNVPCRRSPGRRRCGADIEAFFEASGTRIVWRCPACGDNGDLHGWEGTQWDRRQADVPRRSPALALVEGLSRAKTARQRIRPDDPVPVTFTRAERQMLEDLLIDPDYSDRLEPSGDDFVGRFTLDDLEDILGSVAAEANHTTNKARERNLGRLHERLFEIQRSYDDGAWNDSDV